MDADFFMTLPANDLSTKEINEFFENGGRLERDQIREPMGRKIHHATIELYPKGPGSSIQTFSYPADDHPRGVRLKIKVFGFDKCIAFLDRFGYALSNVDLNAVGLKDKRLKQILGIIWETLYDNGHSITLRGVSTMPIVPDLYFRRLDFLMLIACNVESVFQRARHSFHNMHTLKIDMAAIPYNITFGFGFLKLRTLEVKLNSLDKATVRNLTDFLIQYESILQTTIIEKPYNPRDSHEYVPEEFIESICLHLRGSVEITGFITDPTVADESFYREGCRLNALTISPSHPTDRHRFEAS